MSRQYFMDMAVDPPIANLGSVVATTETALWNVSNYTPIAANESRPGKVWKVTAGGIMSFATTGTLTITPRLGLVIGGATLGASIAQTGPTAGTTAQPWYLEFVCVCRTVGAPGANSTYMGTGFFTTNLAGATLTGLSLTFGGTSATADASIATGIWMGWTLSVAGTVTPQYVFIQSMN